MLKAFIFAGVSAWLLFATSIMASPVDTYEFSDDVSRTRYQTLVKELRCPKCQNQNLADSNSQIAVDLREKVYQMINQGKADKEIVDYMVARYGDFVLYRPQVSKLTYVLWYGPVALVIFGLFIVFLVLRKKPQKSQEEHLSQAQQEKLNQFLKDK